MIEEPCIEFSGYRDRYGYGRRNNARGTGKHTLAHREMWEKYHGSIPSGTYVLHHCDNPPCINITHLFLGTTQDNSLDMVRKGRAAKGERNGGRKLSEQDVLAIRAAEGSAADIARRFGISDMQCIRIRKRIHWRHI